MRAMDKACLTWLSALFFIFQLSTAITCPSGQWSPLYQYWEITKDGNFIKVIDIGPGSGGGKVTQLVVNKCTEVEIQVKNSLDEGTSLHFHGLLQANGYNLMDGPAGLTQSVIPKNGGVLTYRVRADKEGTHWIHGHAGAQYPRGLRFPFIVKNANTNTDDDAKSYGYTTDEIMTVTDVWADFTVAESKSLTTLVADACGKGGDGGFGIEYPSESITINDVGAYGNSADQAGKTYTQKCGESKRLRIVNLASHGRFYLWFKDNRKFSIIELDGVSYDNKVATMAEIASGQRLSILVPGTTCAATALIVVQDPKVSHGVPKCRMDFSDFDSPTQYSHASWNMNKTDGTSTGDQILSFNPPSTAYSTKHSNNLKVELLSDKPQTWLKVWANGTDEGFPSAAIVPTGNDKHDQNRLILPYKKLWYSDDRTKYQFAYQDRPNGFTTSVPIGVDTQIENEMSPKESIQPWFVDFPSAGTPKQIFYITLGTNKQGFAVMAENVKNGGQLYRWESPDVGNTPESTELHLPSMLRGLKRGINNEDPTIYSNTDRNIGRTIVLPNSNINYWFVFKSTVGDHPMHMHGHEFQILARLPPGWFDDATSGQLYSEVEKFWPKDTRATQNPPRRDTIMVEKDVTYVIAIKPDNPGVWALHCHNDIHAASGMFSQIVERPRELRDILGSWEMTGSSDPKVKLINVYPGSATGLTQTYRDIFNNALIAYGKQSSYTIVRKYKRDWVG